MKNARDDNNAKPKATQFTRRDALLTGAGAVAAVGVLSEANPASAQLKSVKDAVEVLQHENDLLDQFVAAANNFSKNLTAGEGFSQAAVDQAKVQGDDWVRYFEGWKNINKRLMQMDDRERNAELVKEIVLLGRFSGQITEEDGETGKFYRETAFNIDIKDTASLIPSPE
jgi:hypothetical protein